MPRLEKIAKTITITMIPAARGALFATVCFEIDRLKDQKFIPVFSAATRPGGSLEQKASCRK